MDVQCSEISFFVKLTPCTGCHKLHGDIDRITPVIHLVILLVDDLHAAKLQLEVASQCFGMIYFIYEQNTGTHRARDLHIHMQ